MSHLALNASNVQKILEQWFFCPIALDRFQKPMILTPCLHKLDEDSVKGLFGEITRTVQGYLKPLPKNAKCPICKNKVTHYGPDTLLKEMLVHDVPNIVEKYFLEKKEREKQKNARTQYLKSNQDLFPTENKDAKKNRLCTKNRDWSKDFFSIEDQNERLSERQKQNRYIQLLTQEHEKLAQQKQQLEKENKSFKEEIKSLNTVHKINLQDTITSLETNHRIDQRLERFVFAILFGCLAYFAFTSNSSR